jgi:hypothetical protein
MSWGRPSVSTLGLFRAVDIPSLAMVNQQSAVASLYQAWTMDPNLYEEFRNQFLAYARLSATAPDEMRLEVTSGSGNQVQFAGRSVMSKQEHQQILGAVLRHIEAKTPPSTRTRALYRPT